MKTSRTDKGNIKIVLTVPEAMALQRLLNHSDAAVIPDGTASYGCYVPEDEEFLAKPLWDALQNVGIIV